MPEENGNGKNGNRAKPRANTKEALNHWLDTSVPYEAKQQGNEVYVDFQSGGRK